MDTIRLESYGPLPTEHHLRYHIFINGNNFIDEVKEVEIPFCIKSGTPTIAGSYLGFSSWDLEYFYNSFIEEGKMEILNCGGCGLSGCWPFVVEISIKNKTLIWNNFFNPHRGPDNPDDYWNYDALGPYIFDKEQYISEFSRALNGLDKEIIPGPRRCNDYNFF